jgi:hypothetical protein
MLIGITLLLCTAWLLTAGFLTGAGAAIGVAAGCGLMACIGMGGAEGVGIGRDFLDRQQILQMHMPMAKVQMAVPIIAAVEVKAQCRSGVCK